MMCVPSLWKRAESSKWCSYLHSDAPPVQRLLSPAAKNACLGATSSCVAVRKAVACAGSGCLSVLCAASICSESDNQLIAGCTCSTDTDHARTNSKAGTERTRD